MDDPGTCTLGCFVELFSADQLASLQNSINVNTSGAAVSAFPVLEEFNSLNLCSDKPGPACVRVQGLCNASQATRGL